MGERKSFMVNLVSSLGRMDLSLLKGVVADCENSTEAMAADRDEIHGDVEESESNPNEYVTQEISNDSADKLPTVLDNDALTPDSAIVHMGHQVDTVELNDCTGEPIIDMSCGTLIPPSQHSTNDNTTVATAEVPCDDVHETSDDGDEHDGASVTFDCVLSESEDSNAYVPGGYHPVIEGEVYDDRYRIECKLGWGYFSTVWLAADMCEKNPRFVAIKFQRSAQNYTDAVKDEMILLRTVRDQIITRTWTDTRATYKQQLGELYNNTCGVVSFLNWFSVKGPNGTHVCVVLEPMGPNLLSLIKLYNFKGVPSYMIRKVTAHVLLGLDYLHRICGIIHTDLKPENILVTSKLHGCVPCLPKDTDSGVNQSSSRKRQVDLSYVKCTIRPSFSDPTSLTSYDELEALQDTMFRMPYHHVPYKISEPLREVNGKSSHPELYHPWVATKVNPKPPFAELTKRKVSVKTDQGILKLKPVDISCFDRPEAIYKICDLGNACWIKQHFTDEIQTRQYRSPEAILKIGYDETADLWSLACIIFELYTGDYLFDPHGNTTQERDLNHLQLIVELLGPLPSEMIRNSVRFHLHENEINCVKQWPLDSVLIRKYKMNPVAAKALADFLLCMLRVDPKDRVPAQELIGHQWLHGTD
eukprot:XP_001611866.1 protein kinase domain containing protein [Babesia bovis T2Bo]